MKTVVFIYWLAYVRSSEPQICSSPVVTWVLQSTTRRSKQKWVPKWMLRSWISLLTWRGLSVTKPWLWPWPLARTALPCTAVNQQYISTVAAGFYKFLFLLLFFLPFVCLYTVEGKLSTMYWWMNILLKVGMWQREPISLAWVFSYFLIKGFLNLEQGTPRVKCSQQFLIIPWMIFLIKKPAFFCRKVYDDIYYLKKPSRNGNTLDTCLYSVSPNI